MRNSLTYPTESSVGSLLDTPITRRSLLAGGASLAAMATAAACGFGTSSSGPAQVSKKTLIYRRPGGLDSQFTTYLGKFKDEYGVDALLSSLSFNYNTVTETELLGGAGFDVMEADGGFLGKWYAAGLIQSLEGLPGLDKLKADMYPSAIADLTAPDGQFAGLPYYTQFKAFFINTELFDRANLKPPQTWAEVIDVARTMKSRGVAQVPFAPIWDKTFNLGTVALGSMAFSEGMQAMFDDKLNPVYESDPIMLQALKNMKTLFAEKLVPQDVMTYFTTGAINSLTAQKSAMFEAWAHNGTSINKAPSPIAGKVKMIPYPGQTHRAWALTAAHVMPKHESDRLGAWKLLTFISGTDKNGIYLTPLNLYGIGIGIPVPYKSVNADPTLLASLGTWVDVPTYTEALSKTVSVGPALNAPWFAHWSDIFVTQMQNVLAGGTDPQSALKTSADYVRSVKK